MVKYTKIAHARSSRGIVVLSGRTGGIIIPSLTAAVPYKSELIPLERVDLTEFGDVYYYRIRRPP